MGLLGTTALLGAGAASTGTTVVKATMDGRVSTASAAASAGSSSVTVAGGTFSAGDVGKNICIYGSDHEVSPRRVADAVATSGSNQITSATIAFTSADVGAWLSVLGAGLGGGAFVAQITSVPNATTAVCNANAQTTVASAGTLTVFGLTSRSNAAQRAITASIDIVANPMLLTCAPGTLGPDDCYRSIVIPGAGPAGASLLDQLVSVAADGGSAVLDYPAGTSVSGVSCAVSGVQTQSGITVQGSAVSVTGLSIDGSWIGGFLSLPGASVGGTALLAQIVGWNGNSTSGTDPGGATNDTTHIQLAASAPAVSLTNCALVITAGTNSGYAGIVTAYNSTTQVATVSPAFAGACDATSVYSILATATMSTPAATLVSGVAATVYPPGPLRSTITAVSSATQVTIGVAAALGAAGCSMQYWTDDTPAVRSALTQVAAGGVLVFPPGVYTLDWTDYTNIYAQTFSALTITENNLRLSGYGATLRRAAGCLIQAGLINIGDSVNAYRGTVVEGLVLDGNSAAASPGITSVGDTNLWVMSDVGCAPMIGVDGFMGGLVVRGPYTPFSGWPKVGQQETGPTLLRDLKFLRWAASALCAIVYTKDLSVVHCESDGESRWTCGFHLDGVNGAYVSDCDIHDIFSIPEDGGALTIYTNGDTGYRPSRARLIGNRIRNIQGNVPAIAGVFHDSVIAGNVLTDIGNVGISMANYYRLTYPMYVGASRNIISNNIIRNTRSGGIVLVGTPGLGSALPAGQFGGANGQDGIRQVTVTTAAGSAAITSSAGFVALDQTNGNVILIPGAGPNGTPLVAQVSAFTDTSHVTLSIAATNALTNVPAVIGRGGTAAMAANATTITGLSVLNAAYGWSSSDVQDMSHVPPATQPAGRWIAIANAGPYGGPLIAELTAVTPGSPGTATASQACKSSGASGTQPILIGGFSQANPNQNQVIGNIISNSTTTKVALIQGNNVWNPISYTKCSLGLSFGNAAAVPVGGNHAALNKFEGCVVDINDRTFGNPSAAGANLANNSYMLNDLTAEPISTSTIVTQDDRTRILSNTRDGLALGALYNTAGIEQLGAGESWAKGTSATWNIGSVPNGTTVSTSVTVNGAAPGDICTVSIPTAIAGVLVSAQVTATNTVAVTARNDSGGAWAGGSTTIMTIRVLKIPVPAAN
jgi:hypothetical protein